MNASGTVNLVLPSTQLGAGEVVLAAALRLLPERIQLVLVLQGVAGEPTREQVDFVHRLCRRLEPQGRPVIVSGEPAPAALTAGAPSIVRIVASADPDDVVSAVVALAAISQAIHVATAQVRVDQIQAALRSV